MALGYIVSAVFLFVIVILLLSASPPRKKRKTPFDWAAFHRGMQSFEKPPFLGVTGQYHSYKIGKVWTGYDGLRYIFIASSNKKYLATALVTYRDVEIEEIIKECVPLTYTPIYQL